MSYLSNRQTAQSVTSVTNPYQWGNPTVTKVTDRPGVGSASVTAVTGAPGFNHPLATANRQVRRADAAASPASTHEVQADNALRSIKSSSGWDWRERSMLWKLRQHYKGKRFHIAYTLYGCLTEMASQQHSNVAARVSCRKLGEMAQCSENAARNYLHEFCEIGLISSNQATHSAKTYYLLAGPTTKLNERCIEVDEGDEMSGPGAADSPAAPRRMKQGYTGAGSTYNRQHLAQSTDELVAECQKRPEERESATGDDTAGANGRANASATPVTDQAVALGAASNEMGNAMLESASQTTVPSAQPVTQITGALARAMQKAIATGAVLEGRGAAGYTPKEARGTDSCTPIQEEYIKQKRSNNTVGGDRSGFNEEEHRALDQMVALGVRRGHALQLVQTSNPQRICQVIAYVRKQRNLYNAPGLAVDLLRSGDPIPNRAVAAYPVAAGSRYKHTDATYPRNTSATGAVTGNVALVPEPAEPGGVADQAALSVISAVPPAAAVNPAVTAPAPVRIHRAATEHETGIWRIAFDELKSAVSPSAWNALRTAQVVGVDENVWLIATVMSHIANYTVADVERTIGSIAGRTIQVKFVPFGFGS